MKKEVKMKVFVELDSYEMKRLFPAKTIKRAKLFAQNIIDRYGNEEYITEEFLTDEG